MRGKYKIIFDGKLNPVLPPTDVREKLLRLYRGDQRVVNYFFAGKRLVVRKNLDQATALKSQELLEKAGVPCRLVQEETDQPEVEMQTAAPEPVTHSAARTTPPQEKEDKRDVSAQQEQQWEGSNALSFRTIIAEAWNLISGVKGEIIGACLLTAMVTASLTFLGYGASRLIGETNLYLIYAFQYGLNLFGYPILAGLIMMGVKRSVGEQISILMPFRFYTIRLLLLSLIITLVDYTVFAVLLSLGIDHFYARTGSILTLPVFAVTAPLVAETGLNPFAALGRFFVMLLRHFPLIAGIYPALFCINIFGNFVIIGFVWTIPLFFVSNGVLFRNLINAEKRRNISTDSAYAGRLASSSRCVPNKPGGPILEGNAWQNVLAVILIGLILVSAGIRFWSLHASGNIYRPAHVAANSKGICVHADKALYFLSPEGRTQRRVELNALGLDREPADLELLEDGSLLIGDMDKKTILHCSVDNLSCRTVGPPNNYKINDYFNFFADEKRGLLFIADTNNHRLLVQDLKGTYYKLIVSPNKIDYPNDLTMDDKGMLWISNTLHERLMGFLVNGDSVTDAGIVINLNPLESGVAAIGQALLRTKDKKQTLGDLKAAQKDIEEMKKDLLSASLDMMHTRPASLAWGSDGNVWVTASDPLRTTAGIRVFDPAGKQVRSIHLDPGAIPDDIIRFGDLLLIADSGLFQVFAVRSDSGNIFPFGDETFQHSLTASRTKMEMYETIAKWTKYFLWVLAVGTTALLLIVLRRRRAIAKQKALNEIS